jgi:mannose-6-phosphate isomerase
VLPRAADPYFVLERVALDGEVTLGPGFAVLVVLAGDAQTGGGLTLPAGSTAVVPGLEDQWQWIRR